MQFAGKTGSQARKLAVGVGAIVVVGLSVVGRAQRSWIGGDLGWRLGGGGALRWLGDIVVARFFLGNL